MSVIVTRFSVNTGEKIYLPGDSISGLSKKEEQALVDAGHCRFPDQVKEAAAGSGSSDDLPEGVIEGPKGTFTLPDGTKIKGKAKAVEAFAKLQPQDPPASEDDPDTEGTGPNTGLPE